jgi:outer membrane protein OmpA-like peptidoglycan-associated protein/Tol biopolymer transport system component
MRRIRTVSAMFLFALLFSFSNLIALENENTIKSLKCISNDYHLYAYVIETAKDASSQQDAKSTAKEDEGDILSNKQIRIINLGPVVNTEYYDAAPTVSPDGKTLYFVSKRKGSVENSDGTTQDFWAARKNDRLDTIFQKPYNIDPTSLWGKELGVNTVRNEGAASLSGDKQTLYFTGCNRPDGLGRCDIYKTTIEGDKWGKPINLRAVNTKHEDTQPSITVDGKRLYFASTRPGPNSDGEDSNPDNLDIWYSDLDSDTDEWTVPKNLTEVNSKGIDWTPFIAADGEHFYFASNGWKPNYGGTDFYSSVWDPDTKKFTTPRNLGRPINTELDERYITMPAFGGIIYFSSDRKDLPGYQGNLDIFMAFVPTFFKTKIVKVQVIDECSGINIPATITMKNNKTKKTFLDSVSLDKKWAELVIDNTHYGDSKDSTPFINMDILAENPKYDKSPAKIVRIDRPGKTSKSEEAGSVEDEIKVTITLAQRPVLATEIDEAAYVSKYKDQRPEIANFRGLVMEKVQTWTLYPLLNYVFFDLGKTELPSRYVLFNSPEQTKNFTDTTIAEGTLNKYYNILNIFGFRMNRFPDEKIEIVGCNDDINAEEKAPGVSENRAKFVFNYLKNIWNISENRMKLTIRKKPDRPDDKSDKEFGPINNRRVEIRNDSWNIRQPIFDKDPKTFPQPEQMNYTMKNGIEDELIESRRIEIYRGDKLWKTLKKVGITDPKTTWDWTNDDSEYPKDEVPYTATLVIRTKSGAECKSNPVVTPVMQASTEKQKIDNDKDSTKEIYSLILFPFDSYDAGPLNDRILKDYVIPRCFPVSEIEVVGHTDVIGLADHNKKLSDNRSNTVYNGILKATGSKVGKISKRGVGEDEPLYDNSLPECRYYNRTVQMIIKTPVSYFK